ncbi:hypothetical protein EJ110_NYTH29087 [Nymphaea thermarum]|nr:hypothetical protein EJ110_NYTH29087 [Nymphaea thermarum]
MLKRLQCKSEKKIEKLVWAVPLLDWYVCHLYSPKENKQLLLPNCIKAPEHCQPHCKVNDGNDDVVHLHPPQLLVSSALLEENGASNITSLFVFGDSLVDNGNNIFFAGSTAKANYPPCGIDFGFRTGRFNNDKTVADVLGQLLGLPNLLLCFTNPSTKGPMILSGVNHASGSYGILDSTNFSVKLSLLFLLLPSLFLEDGGQQIRLPLRTPRKRTFWSKHPIQRTLSVPKAMFPPRPLFVFVERHGSDTIQPTNQLNRQEYSNFSFSQWLYGLGARKFALLSIQVIGCTPVARLTTTDCSCNETYNAAFMQFNTRLNASIDTLTWDLPGSHFVFINSYKIMTEMIDSPADHGMLNDFLKTKKVKFETKYSSATAYFNPRVFLVKKKFKSVFFLFHENLSIFLYIFLAMEQRLTVVDKPCCAVTSSHCKKNGGVCEDRNTYLFFDDGHPTNAANPILARRMYLSDNKSDVYPINVKHLADLSPDSSGAGLSSEAPKMDMINELSVE